MEGDPYLIYRIVGYHEYTKAMRFLSQFVMRASSDELTAAEEIVRDQPQYEIYDLYRSPDKGKASPPPATVPYDVRAKVDPGLARVIALARVEVAAMLAGFAHHNAPFEAVGPMPYDLEAFTSFVVEGARVNYQAIAADPQSRAVAERFPPNEITLAYIRRLSIARHFLLAAVQLKGLEQGIAVRDRNLAVMAKEPEKLAATHGALATAAFEGQQLLVAKRELDLLHQRYTNNLRTYVQNMTRVATLSQSRTYEQMLQQCMDGLCGDRREVDERPKVYRD